jgi:CobQ/CobB/MinD/ParA nucleotide binding domain
MRSIFETIGFLESLTRSTGDAAPLLSAVRTTFIAPSLHVDAISEGFGGLDDEERLRLLQSWINQTHLDDPIQLADVMVRLPVTIDPVTTAEANAKLRWGGARSRATWVSSFLETPKRRSTDDGEVAQKYVHFYGYKGGQGRSTVLGLLAKALADDGYRVLLVDADIEAPSLDLLFGVTADSFSQTLMGLCGWADEFQPIAGAHAGRSGGRVDILPCRPRTEAADLDFALLVASAPLDARVYEWAAQRLEREVAAGTIVYDVVMVDHRTGIASSVLPLMHRLRGSAAVFARTDFNTAKVPSELRRVVRSIFASTVSVPGTFVAFSLDPNRGANSARSPVEARVREQLLGELAAAIESTEGADQVPEVSVTELSLNWVDWYVDRALLEPSLPDVQKLQSDNIASLGLLRETLGLPIGRKAELALPRPTSSAQFTLPASSLSGAKDSGQFIHIPEVDSLFVPGNPYSYILGRKGTGKTRLLREMVIRGLGTPLLVASDETSTAALQSQSIEATEWLQRCSFDASTFWWSLLRMSIERIESSDRRAGEIVQHHLTSGTEPRVLADRLAIKSLLVRLSAPQVLLVDGLETLVPAAKIKEFVTALFSLMSTVQNDPALASRLVIRAFVREDLAADSVQNVEQQMEGRYLRLKWSASSILNFAISRLPTLGWVRTSFAQVCEGILERRDDVGRGALSEQEATALMLRVFPERLRRNNLSTATFLRLYFSDAGGDDTNKATFYPRLYLSFLQKLDELASQSSEPLDQSGRVTSALLNRAYDEASSEFINETKQELSHLLSLEYQDDDESGNSEDDQTRVTKFIAAFDGLSTPFEHEAIVEQLQLRTHFKEKSVRESLQRMKAIRMFEDRPGYGGWWRVGQLYKMGLRMKYVRGQSSIGA